jgi:hypothetical protein
MSKDISEGTVNHKPERTAFPAGTFDLNVVEFLVGHGGEFRTQKEKLLKGVKTEGVKFVRDFVINFFGIREECFNPVGDAKDMSHNFPDGHTAFAGDEVKILIG